MEKLLAVRGWNQVGAVCCWRRVLCSPLVGVVGELIFHLDRSEGSPLVETEGGNEGAAAARTTRDEVPQ